MRPNMFVFLRAAVFLLFTHSLTQAARYDKCDSRCDVSSCPSPSCPGGYVPDRCNCCLVCAPREGDPCGRKNDLPCADGLVCKLRPAGRLRGSKRACRCKLDHELCGSDGKTYGNVCKMKAASRKAVGRGRAAVSQAHKGPCAPPGAGRTHGSSRNPRYKFNFIADVVEKIAPAVVHIELFVRHPLFGRHVRVSSGSGFIVTHTGVIVTNAHVVTTAGTVTGRLQLRVQLHDGDAYEAVVRDVDKKADIATIKISSQKKLHVLSLGRSADLRPGEFVVAIGSPFALQNTVTTGIVSTTQRDGKELGIRDSDMDYIQTDAIINDGEVIGINTLKVTAGISFAIPADRISRFLADSQDKHSKGGSLSLMSELKHQNPDLPDISGGVLVQQVVPNTPAERGGIKAGDVIVKLDGQPVQTTEDIQNMLQSDRPLLLEIRRGNDDLLFNVQPQQRML
uniref:Serine protease HTRA2, mitochondrial n=1 Tax=Nothobranchius furzeri TaxID=105023 RepID=A0A8C6KVY6_NOTFU